MLSKGQNDFKQSLQIYSYVQVTARISTDKKD